MPSSLKTNHLKLNRWQGTDKPKREDFNADNTLVDNACSAMAAGISAVDGAHQSFKTSTGTALSGLDTRCSGLDTRCTNLNSDLTSHKSNTTSHITAAERSSWNNILSAGNGMVTGTYMGNGSPTMKVTMGFKPKCGFLFAIGAGVAECAVAVNHVYLYSAFFGSQGCSLNVKVESDGITVTHSTTVPASGTACYYNAAGKTYVYVAWRP